jgi:ribosome biogenesis GTP-binding protein YsxC/EngB
MRITKASYLCSMESLKKFPGQGRPEIALVGRSNVGKSSLINSLCNNRRLARTSSEPGKTRMVNVYSVNDAFFLVDLPGYGFAKASGDERRRWTGMIEGYLRESQNLKHVFLLTDIRHEPTEDDCQMAQYLRHYGLPFTVIATKADKVSKAEKSRNLPVICRKLVVQPWQLMTYSSETNEGRDGLISRLQDILNPAEPVPDGIQIEEGLTFDDGPTKEM